jgi:hypothetical protein
VTNLAPAAAIGWGLFITAAQYYGCFGGVGGLLAGAVVAPGVAFFFVFFFFFSPVFGAVGSAAGA